MDYDKIEKILENLNKIRTAPKTCVKDLETISKGLVRFMKKKEGQELLDFSKTLGSRAAVGEVILSSSLTKVAQMKLDLILKEEEEIEEDMQLRYSKNVVGYSEIKEMSDVGEIESVIGRLLISELDPQRLYRQAIFNKAYGFVGIATGTKDNADITVLTFADAVIDPASKPLDEQILTSINFLRKYPYKSISKLNEQIAIPGVAKPVIDSTLSFIPTISNLALKEVKRDAELDDVATYIFEKIESKEIKDISNLDQISQLAKNSIHGFSKIHAACVKNIKNPNAIASTLLLDPKEKNSKIIESTRELINSKNITKVGIAVIGEFEKFTTIVIIGVDTFYSGSEREYLDYITDEINRFRETPASYVSDLQNYKSEINIKTYKGKVIKEIYELSSNLKTLPPLPKIENHELLNSACEDYVYLGIVNNGKHYVEDDDMLEKRLKLSFSGFSKARVFIDVGSHRPEHFITELLVSERDNEKKGRSTLQDPEIKYFGFYHSIVNNDKFTVLILTDKVDPKQETKPEDDFLDTLNLFRGYPLSLVKEIFKFKEDLELKKKSATQSTFTKKKGAKSNDEIVKAYDEKIAFADELVTVLKKIRITHPVERYTPLDKAASEKLALIESEGANNYTTTEEIRDFLSDHISNHFYVAELHGKLSASGSSQPFNATSLIVKLIFDSLSIDFVKSLMFINFNKIGISFNPETETILAFLVDHALDKTDIKIPVNLRQRVKRPELTPDEVEQIRYDFNRLDIFNQGFIIPNTILLFVNNSRRFVNNNPLYYEAIQSVNSIENNEIGINVNQFIDAVKTCIKKLEDKDWENFYEIYLRESQKRALDFSAFEYISKKLGYEMSESELKDTFERIANEKGNISKEEFLKIMKAEHRIVLPDVASSA